MQTKTERQAMKSWWQLDIDDRLAMFPDFLTTREVASILGVTKWAVYKKVKRGQIPFYSAASSRLIFVRSEIRQWAAEQG